MNDFLVAILNGINSVIHNYGWSMVVFTLLIKLVLLPLDYKSRKSMRRMTKLQPQIAKLQAFNTLFQIVKQFPVDPV